MAGVLLKSCIFVLGNHKMKNRFTYEKKNFSSTGIFHYLGIYYIYLPFAQPYIRAKPVY